MGGTTAGPVACCIAGGGPAGLMLAYLLARAGVEVLVLEKHQDFLRDFRGDTIHPSTLKLIDHLGLAAEFARLPMRTVDRLGVTTDEGTVTIVDFARVGGAYRLGFLPQWDFLDFLAEQGRRFPGFRLRMGAEVVGLVTEHGRVCGVRVREAGQAGGDGGQEEIVRAELVVAADGRTSAVRAASGLQVIDFGAPMDVMWFRIPRTSDDPAWAFGRLARGRFLLMIDRGDYWQAGYVIAKGHAERIRAAGVGAFRAQVAELAPFVAGRLDGLASMADVALLTVRVDRLRRWWRPGLLCIGDAAHAMSPVGGIGINLAVQDAVAAARILAPALRADRIDPALRADRTDPALRAERTDPALRADRVSSTTLARVQARRLLPAVLTQRAQRTIQNRLIRPVLAGGAGDGMPVALRVLRRVPALQAVPAFLLSHAVLAERPPKPWPPPSRAGRD